MSRTLNLYEQARKADSGFLMPATLRKKRISFILPKVSYEGVAKVGLMQANFLKTGCCHQVEVISLIKEKQRFEELLANLRVKYVFPIAVLSRSCYTVFAKFMKPNSDLTLAHNIPATVVANGIFRKHKIPYIAYIHDATFDKIPGSFPSFKYDRIKQSLSSSAFILTNSMKTLKELDERYKIQGFPLHPGCFPVDQVNDRRRDFFLFVHFISPRASFKFLKRLLEKEKFNLVIAGGRRWGWQKVFHAFQNLGNRVKFIFEPTENELSALYQRARGLIFPELENFGLSPLEAAACGCPSIVAEGSGVLEILEQGKGIIVRKEGDLEGFGEALRTLTEDEKYARELGKEAWNTAQKHSWNLHVSKLAQIIETLGKD